MVLNQRCKFCEIEMDPVNPHLSPAVIFRPYEPRPVNEPTDNFIGPFEGINDVLEPTVRLFRDSLWFITKLVFVIVAPLELLKIVSGGSVTSDWQFQTGTFLLQMLSNLIIAPALIFGLMKWMQTGEHPGINQSFRWGVGKLGRLGLSAVMAGLIMSLGYVFCIVPGIVFTVALALVYPLAVLERGSPMEIIRSSQKLTEGHRWNIFFAGLAVYGIVAGLSWGIDSAAAFGVLSGAYWVTSLAGIITAILNQSPTILSLVIYLSIRRTLEGEQAQ